MYIQIILYSIIVLVLLAAPVAIIEVLTNLQCLDESSESNKKIKKSKKLGLFKGLTSEITNKFRKFKTNNVTSNDDVLAIADIEIKEVIEDEPILKTRLTRKEKIGPVRDFSVFHSSKLGIYCISVPKDDKKLQKFIRDEYKKEYPNEKIQSIENEENKILVLTKDPYMFKK